MESMRPYPQNSAGFTLIELMVSITLLTILLSIAVPSFKNASLGSQLRTSASDLMASTNLARSEAIKRNAVVTLCASSGGTSCDGTSWEQGWIILSGAEVLRRQSPAPQGFKITTAGALTSLTFQPAGVGSTATSFTVCRATPSVSHQQRVVTLDSTGRTWVKNTSLTSCP